MCPADVHAANLDRHLNKVHRAELHASGQDGALRLRGTDRRIARVAVVLIMAAGLGAFGARLELVGEQLRLRWLFGLGARAVTLPAKLETGTLLERKTSAMHIQRDNSEGKAVPVGTYLRLRGGGGSITIGVKQAGGPGKRWAQGGWAKAKKTRWVDIEVDRAGLVALEYHRATRRQLMPRPSRPSRP